MTPAERFHVLIATDGSPAAKAAVATAVRFPWPDGVRGAGLIVRHVPSSYRRSILLVDRTADAVAKRTARVMSRRWPDAQVRVADASPVEGILREAAQRRANVIVLGWRGHGAVRRLLTGSVSRSVARRAPCAVLVVRSRREVRRIVIGVDGSAHARSAVEFVSRLSPPPKGRVSLFTAVDMMQVPTQALLAPDTRGIVSAEVERINKERLAGAHQSLDGATRTLTRAGWKVDRVVTPGAPLHDLLATAARKRVDLVVVGAREG